METSLDSQLSEVHTLNRESVNSKRREQSTMSMTSVTTMVEYQGGIEDLSEEMPPEKLVSSTLLKCTTI
jgi:hypothetical protein